MFTNRTQSNASKYLLKLIAMYETPRWKYFITAEFCLRHQCLLKPWNGIFIGECNTDAVLNKVLRQK